MASLVYDSYFGDLNANNINPGSDTFKAMLVTSTYTPNKGTHTKRSDVTNEVTGTGYSAGGTACTVSVVATDTTNHRADITLGAVSWGSSTITARGLVVYKSTGTASTDNLVAYIDFGSDVTSSGGTFSVSASTIRIQN